MQIKKNQIIDLPGLKISPVNRIAKKSCIITMKWRAEIPRAATIKRTIERIKGKIGHRELNSDLHPEEEKGLETSHVREPNEQKALGVGVVILAPRSGKN